MSYQYTDLDGFAKELFAQKDNLILQSLNDLISRNLLVLEEGPMVLTTDYNNPNKVILSQQVRLVLKDKEYIENLELENIKMRNELKEIKDLINKITKERQ